MIIGFVIDDSLDKSDGVQQYVLTLGQYFRTQGHEVHYLTGETLRTDIKNIHSLSRNLQVHFNQNRMSTPLPGNRQKIVHLLNRVQFDVLHVQMPYSPVLAGRIIKNINDKVVLAGTFHIVPFSNTESIASRVLALVLRRSLLRFDKVYSVSKPAKEFAKNTFKIKSEVLPNVVNFHKFASAKPYSKLNDGKINIVFLGRLVERKGCMYLLMALEKLHSRHRLDRVKVIICGKGPLQKSLEKYVNEHHLKHIVKFVGYVDELSKARYLSSADIAVFPSTGGESFGIVLLEAMAAGAKVVLAGDNVGYRSVMGEHPDQIIKTTDVDSFATQLDHFINSFTARNKASNWQKKHVKQYDVSIVGDIILKEYSQSKDQKFIDL